MLNQRSSRDRSSWDKLTQDRSSRDMSSRDRSSRDRLSQDRSFQDRSSEDSQVRTGQVRTSQVIIGQPQLFLILNIFWTKILDPKLLQSHCFMDPKCFWTLSPKIFSITWFWTQVFGIVDF